MTRALRQPDSIIASTSSFHDAVVTGLSHRAKSIPSRFLYDATGCELFEQITQLDAYYPTRTERQLLAAHAADVAALVPPGAAVVEFGAGSGSKTRLLLDRLAKPVIYVPVDIAPEAVADIASGALAEEDGITVHPVVGDFTEGVVIPPFDHGRPRLGLFLGSTIGNFRPRDAVAFLERTAADLRPGALLLVGVDRRKAEQVLLHAYDDPDGVTASFNLNVLRRANRELGANFDLSAFKHAVRWNDDESRIEMHLVSTRAQAVRIGAETFRLAEGETIHTENSYKYEPREFRLLARCAGWTPRAAWTDADGLYSLHLLAN